jgi:hypothetical protein
VASFSWLGVGAFEGEVGRVDDGVFVVLDAQQETAQEGRDGQCDDGDEHNGQTQPEGEGVPLPSPELAGEGEGTGAGGVDQTSGGKGHGCGVEDDVAETDEGDDEQKFEGIDEVVGELRGGHVETKKERRGEADEGGATDDGVDADEEAYGDAPGKLSRGCSHAEECEDGKRDAAVGPVVMERRGAGLGAGWGHFARGHC